MRVLLDECVDWRLSRDIREHEVWTARQMGWSAMQNGRLLELATEHFDVFVTVDRNLSFQQHIDDFEIAVIVLSARSNRLEDLRTLVPQLLALIRSAEPGSCTVIRP